MATTKAQNSVEVFHLNAGAGDSQIVCWLKRREQTDIDLDKAKREWLLHTCVLIDGGFPPPEDHGEAFVKNAKDNSQKPPLKLGFAQSLTFISIVGALEQVLPRRYALPDEEKRVYLDAIVITHWDADHYGGVFAFMKDDLRQQFEELNKDKTKDEDPDTTKVRGFSFARYDANGKPLTSLYVPYLSSAEKKDKGPRGFTFDEQANTITTTGIPTTWGSYYFHNIKLNIVAGCKNLVGFNIFNSFRPPALSKNLDKDEETWEQMLSKDFPAPYFLVKEHQKSSATQPAKGISSDEPGLFIIRAHRRGFYNDTTGPNIAPGTHKQDRLQPYPKSVVAALAEATSMSTESPASLLEGEPSYHTVGAPMIFPKDEPNTKASFTNSASIICIIAWPGKSGKSNDGTVPISHYLGGDATWDEEKIAAFWLLQKAAKPGTSSKSVAPHDKLQVSCLKLSHHGAVNSTPFELIENLKPRYVVNSAGRSHRHPRLETILWLRAWSMKLRSQDDYKTRDPKFFIPTRFPYYLVYVKNNGKYEENVDALGSINALVEASGQSPEVYYLNNLREQWDASQKDLKTPKRRDPIDTWQRKVLGPDGKKRLDLETRKKDLMHLVEGAFEEISSFPANVVHTPSYHAELKLDFNFTLVHLEQDCVFTPLMMDASKALIKFDQNLQQAPPTAQTMLAPSTAADVQPDRANEPKAGASASASAGLPPNARVLTRSMTARMNLRDYRAEKLNPEEYEFEQMGQAEETGYEEKVPYKTRLRPRPPKPNLLLASAAADTAALQTTTALRESPKITPQWSDSYTIVSSTCQPKLTISHEKLTQDNPLDAFFNDLLYRSMTFNNPAGQAKPDQAELLVAHNQDDVLSWLRVVVKAKAMRLRRNKEVKDTDPTWQELCIDVDAQSLAPSAPSGTSITFSTDALAKVNFKDASGVTGPTALNGPSGCYLSAWRMLVFALKNTDSPPVAVTLGGVLTCFGLTTDHVALKGFAAVADTVKLTLKPYSDNSPSRNALWFNPSRLYQTTLRLEFNVEAKDVLNKVLKDANLNISVTEATVVAKKTVSRSDCFAEGEVVANTESEIIFCFTVSDGPENTSLSASIGFERGLFTLCLKPAGKWTDALVWMLDKFTDAKSDDEKKLAESCFEELADAAGTIQIQSIEVTGSFDTIYTAKANILLPVKFGRSDQDTKRSAFLLSLIYDKSASSALSFTGQLYSPVERQLHPDAIPDEYSPFSEDYNFAASVADPNGYADGLDITTLFVDSPITVLPSNLDVTITRASLALSTSSFYLEGSIECERTKPEDAASNSHAHAVAFEFRSLDVSASYDWGASGKSFALSLSTQVELISYSEKDKENPANATFWATLNYQLISGMHSWTVYASIDDLRLDFFTSFFPPDERPHVARIASHLLLSNLQIQYEYDQQGKDSDFAIMGRLVLGPLELDLDFHRTVETKDDKTVQITWAFDAILKNDVNQAKATLNQLLFALTNDDTVFVPSFADIELDGSLSFMLYKSSTDAIVCVVQARLDGFALDLVQIIEKKPANAHNLASTNNDSIVKRCLILTIDSLPWDQIPNIAVVGKIQPPFTKLQYMLVHGGDGLTYDEVKEINQVKGKITDFPTISIDEPTGGAPKDGNTIAVDSGSHFIVLDQDSSAPDVTKTLLNYRFGAVPQKQAPSPSPGPADGGTSGASGSSAAGSGGRASAPAIVDGRTKLVRLNKSQGPLTIANFGLRYSSDKGACMLHIILDATIMLGPLEFALKGFEAVLTFASGTSLRNISPKHIAFHLSGMALAFDKPPVVIAGLFENDSANGNTKYSGGAVLGIEPYAFVAAGSYGEIQAQDHMYKSVFVFAELAGPLVEIEFGEINDITAGFGYNSALRFPSVDDIQNFPFIKDVFAPATDPLDLLSQLTSSGGSNSGWISQQEGPLWMAAGLGVRAFQVLDVKAVVALEFNPYASLGIFAKATLALPSSGPGKPADPTKSFLYAEVGIVSSVDFHAGTMQLAARLMPQSFILHPSCQLSGGFAMCYWFGDNAHAGDWVVTVGGYHPAYQRPSHYPTVERVAISWSMGGGVNVHGEAYFAITPKVCMAGGLLRATFDAGPLSAYFDARADFLVNYQPFHFTADVDVDVGVRFSLHVWFVTIHISAEVGASLELWGPPVGGIVHVDLYIVSFSIPIGDSRRDVGPIGFDEFWSLLRQQPGASPDNKQDQDGGIARGHTLSVKEGLVTKKGPAGAAAIKSVEGEPWLVRLIGATFTVQTKFAISECQLGNDSAGKQTSQNKVYSKPMQLPTDFTSSLKITITKPDQPDETFTDWKLVPVTKSVPKAVWGQYLPNSDDSDATLLSGSPDQSVDLWMALNVISPPPEFSKDRYHSIDAVEAMQEDVFSDKDSVHPTKDDVHPTIDGTLVTSDDGARAVTDPNGKYPKINPIQAPSSSRSDDVALLKTKWSPSLGIDGLDKLATTVQQWSIAMGWIGDQIQPSQPVNMIAELGELFATPPLCA